MHIRERYNLHADLVDAIEARAADKAEALIHAHNTSVPGAEHADPVHVVRVGARWPGCS